MGNINVMLVDDEKRFLLTTKKMLERKGYKVKTASSGSIALEKLKGNDIHVVILDVKMPGMDGITTLKKIKERFPQVEVIMLTGHATVESAVDGLKYGAADYLMKPASIEDIDEKIEAAFAKRQILDNQTNIRREYFKKVRFRLIIGLLFAVILPYAVLSVYFHIQFNSTLKNIGKLNLEALSISQRNTIDLFLQERVVNLFSLFHGSEFTVSPSQHNMESYLQTLRQVSDSFIDIGFLNEEGIQIGYTGPFPHLQGKDYSDEQWFKTLLNLQQDYFISDIYLGFRKKPHFTIATRQIIGKETYIMRSTLDPDKFYIFLRTISHGKGVESSLINREGQYQIVDPDRGKLLGQSEYIPPLAGKSGVMEVRRNGDSILIAYAWLKETPWALIVRQPLSIALAQMYRTRRIMTASLACIIFSIAAAIWFTSSRLLSYAQSTAEKQDELKHQLIHASKLASIGELATGVAHEINNPLATIVATTGVIRDMLDPQFDLDASPENIQDEIDVIDSAAFRAKGITQQLLDFGRKDEPRLALCNVNELLDKVLSGLKIREFTIKDIEIIRNYDPDLPEIPLDSDQLSQVFLNLINNAGDAISGSGRITISTGRDEEYVLVTIKDTGEGMTAAQMKEIFNPFYTTKEVGKGTGLGLSVSLSIVETMGGTIDVQSLEGTGSSFTVSLPISKS